MHSIAERLLARAARGSRAPHDDGGKIALAIEGGAMRGIVSAGMVSGLQELGLTHAFDAVYGSSAGAFNAAYFLAGQADLGTRIYSEDINNRAFTSMRRAMSASPVVNVDFLVDVMTREKPLSVETLFANGTPLAVLATDVESGTRAAFRRFEDGPDLFAAMRAGATMPILAGGPFRYRGRQYFDASLSEPIPVPIAEEDGFTDIVVLLTRPPLHYKRLSSLVERVLVTRPLRNISPDLAVRFETRGAPYSALLATIDGGHGPRGRAQVLGLRPDGVEVSKLERRRDVLLAAAEGGRQAVLRAFGRASARPNRSERPT